MLRNYLDTVLELPWNVKTKERVDVAAARKILEHDHFGLEKVKERILETIAVREMAPEMPPQILCLVGPPGVGKTSIAYSIARSLNRKLAQNFPWRHSRRGGHPGTPEDLRRRNARPYHDRHDAGGQLQSGAAAGRDRQIGLRLPRRSQCCSAGSAGRGTEPRLPGPLSGNSL